MASTQSRKVQVDTPEGLLAIMPEEAIALVAAGDAVITGNMSISLVNKVAGLRDATCRVAGPAGPARGHAAAMRVSYLERLATDRRMRSELEALGRQHYAVARSCASNRLASGDDRPVQFDRDMNRAAEEIIHARDATRLHDGLVALGEEYGD